MFGESAPNFDIHFERVSRAFTCKHSNQLILKIHKHYNIIFSTMVKVTESQEIALETPIDDVFVPPSIKTSQILGGASYAHHSTIPYAIENDMSTECVLGVDEAGRGPVLGILSNSHILAVSKLILEISQVPWSMDFSTCL